MSQTDTNLNYDADSGISHLILKLCDHLANNDKSVSESCYKLALRSFPSLDFNVPPDEQYIVEKIKKHLLAAKGSEGVREFENLYSQLKRLDVLQNKSSVLAFLLNLSQQSCSTTNSSTLLFLKKSKEATSCLTGSKSNVTFLPDSRSSVKRLYTASKTSAVSSKSHLSSLTNGQSIQWVSSENEVNLYKGCSSGSSSALSLPPGMPEDQVLYNLIYAFLGVEGEVLKREPGGLGFVIDIKRGKHLNSLQKNVIESVLHLGYLHNKIKQHCDEADIQIGLIGQALVSTIRDKLTEYYEFMSVLLRNVKPQDGQDFSDLTMRRCLVWIREPFTKMQWYASILELCLNKKGGALITEVYAFLMHGCSTIQQTAAGILEAVCKPFYMMLLKWLIEGQITDPLGEFFIEIRSVNAADRLWHDKYFIRKNMIPNFITQEQATQILATGKNINFLKQICKDNEGLAGNGSLQKLLNHSTADDLYIFDKSIELHTTLDKLYRETSLRVVDLLKEKYRLLDHLQALRRYLLLGQGDFIRHLLELLAPELCKPAQDLVGHVLQGILETAIRVTNAQYEDEDTLRRIIVIMRRHSHGDTGWDVFNLMYIVDGPVGTIFQPTMATYQGLFGVLWMAKRMEFVLSNMRKQQITSAKLFRQIPVVRSVTHHLHVLTSEMIHFLHQTQYYFLFEVIECSWADLLTTVNQAETLDDVIDAHSKFLSSVQNGVLLTPESTELHSQLRVIYTLILNVEALQQNLYMSITKECEADAAFRMTIEQSKGFAYTIKDEAVNMERQAKFKHMLDLSGKHVKQLAHNFRQFILKYVSLLAVNPDPNLQLLSTRLNFNNYYNIA